MYACELARLHHATLPWDLPSLLHPSPTCSQRRGQLGDQRVRARLSTMNHQGKLGEMFSVVGTSKGRGIRPMCVVDSAGKPYLISRNITASSIEKGGPAAPLTLVQNFRQGSNPIITGLHANRATFTLLRTSHLPRDNDINIVRLNACAQ